MPGDFCIGGYARGDLGGHEGGSSGDTSEGLSNDVIDAASALCHDAKFDMVSTRKRAGRTTEETAMSPSGRNNKRNA